MAEEGGYCIPAFNVYNIETVMGVIKAAEEAKAPVILAAAKKATVPVCFHLDHGATENEIQRILYWGATGLMYDGSVHPY